MKYLFISFCIFISCSLFAQDLGSFTKSCHLFYSKYVDKGKLHYSSIAAHPASLNELVTVIGNMRLSDDSTGNKAFYINSYNLLVISQVTQNYPLSSVRDVKGFFDHRQFLVAGKRMTLNQLENDVIRKTYADARIHFALVCGANGCPPIIDRAYDANSLEEELEEQTIKAINNPDFIFESKENKEILVNPIFNWYKEDFGASDKAVQSFINRYRALPLSNGYKIKYTSYDWSLNEYKAAAQTNQEVLNTVEKQKPNLQTYTPSILLKTGQWEFKSFQNFYTQTGGYNSVNQYTDYGNRSSFFSSINQFTYGINGTVNLGADLWFKRVHYGSRNDPALDLFTSQSSSQSRSALTGLGPKVRLRPVKKWEHFSINSTFLVPISKDLNGSESVQNLWLSRDAYLWITQFYYDQSLGQKFQLFFQLAPWYSIAKKVEASKNQFELPLDIFFSFFPSKRWTLYLQNGYWPTFEVDSALIGYFVQGGAGAKYQVIPSFLELELSYTNFYYGWQSGAGQTFNFGIRMIR